MAVATTTEDIEIKMPETYAVGDVVEGVVVVVDRSVVYVDLFSDWYWHYLRQRVFRCKRYSEKNASW